MADESQRMKAVDALEHPVIELRTVERAKLDTLLEHTAALAARLLALLGGKSIEEIGKIAIAAIVPLEMAIAPEQPAGRGARVPSGLIDEQRVGG